MTGDLGPPKGRFIGFSETGGVGSASPGDRCTPAGRVVEGTRMSTQRIALAFILASLLTGCGMFGGPAQTERDTDAVQRAEDPYHTDPKYNAYAGYNPKTQEGSESGLSVIGS